MNIDDELREEFRKLADKTYNEVIKLSIAPVKCIAIPKTLIDTLIDVISHEFGSHLTPKEKLLAKKLRWFLSFIITALKKLLKSISKISNSFFFHYQEIEWLFVFNRTKLKPTDDGKSDSLNSLNKEALTFFSNLMSNHYEQDSPFGRRRGHQACSC